MNRLKAAYDLLVGRRKAIDLNLTESSAWLTLGGGPSTAGISVNEKTLLEMSTSWRCIRLISETIGTMPLHLYRRTDSGRKRETEHKLYRLIHFQPNPYMTASEWMESLAVSLCVYGQAYNDITRVGERVAGIVPVPKPNVRPELKSDGTLIYHYTQRGRTEERTRAEICPIKGFGGSGNIEGYPAYQLQKNSIGLSLAAEKYGAEFFQKGGRPSGVFSGEKWPSVDEVKLFEEMFKKRDGRPLFVGGKHEYQPLSTPHNEAQFMELREFQVRETANIWGVSPDMVGVSGGQTYNNVEQRNLQFLTYTLRPYLVRIEQALNSCLLTRAEQRDLYIEFDVNGLLRGDAKARSEYYRNMRMISAITANEIRDAENLPRDPNGDDLLAPLNMAPLDQFRAINNTDNGGDNGDL